jgi:hypothetical protein
MDVQLAHSRDGYGWHRTAIGERFIPRGLSGTWEGGMVVPATAPVMLAEEIRFYYGGQPYLHGQPHAPGQGCIGTASLRPDGFIALHAGEGPGELMTRPFAVREPGIYLNARATDGQVRVAVCEGSSAEPFEGFGFDECIPVRGDGIAQEVRWRGDADQTLLVDRPIRLRVRAQHADLYSVCLANGGDPLRYWEFTEITGRDPLYDLGEA